MTSIKIRDDWKDETRLKSLIWNDSHALLKNDLYISGIINLTRNDDDDDDKNLNLINLNDKTNSSISFNNENLKWIIGTGIDNNMYSSDNFGIININNGYSGVYLEPNNGNWYSLSDLRLKNIISTIDQSLEKINKIRAVYYTWKLDTANIKQVGVIAQDVLEVFKEAVSIPKDPETQNYGVSYTNLIPLLLSGIQELDLKINTNSNLLSNNNILISANNTLIFELKEITEINKKYIDLKQTELKLLLNDKINEINVINNKQQTDIDENSKKIYEIITKNTNELNVKYDENINVITKNYNIKYDEIINVITKSTNELNVKYVKYDENINVITKNYNELHIKYDEIINIINIKTDDNKLFINNKVSFLENLIETDLQGINNKNNEFLNNMKDLIKINENSIIKNNDETIILIEKNNDQIKFLEFIIEDLKNKNVEFEIINKSLVEKNEMLILNQINMVKKNTEIENEIKNLKDQNQELKDYIQVLNNKNKNVDDKINDLVEKVNNNLTNTVNELTTKMNEQQKNTNIFKNKIEIMQNMINNLQKKSSN